MKLMNKTLRLTPFFLSAAVFLIASCGREPREETIRLYVRASDAYAQGRFTDVIDILQGQNNFPPALILRAKAEYFSRELEKAEKTCRRVIKIRPSLSEANLYLARVLREKGDLTGAVDTLQIMLTDNPQDIRALRLSAEISMETGRFDDAVILLDRAAEFSAESALVLLDRARLKWITGGEQSLQLALDDLSRAKAMLPWDTPLKKSISNLENTIMGAQ